MEHILDTLITDRIPFDVDRALYLDKKGWARMTEAERAEYSAGPKGAYCYIDLNRVKDAMEYLEGLMNAAGVTSGYTPVQISHVGFGQRRWTDTTWIAYDKPKPAQWAAHLENVRQFWAYVQTIEAAVLPKYDPRGEHRIHPEETFTGGDVCTISVCSGLVRFLVEVTCDPDSVSVTGEGWEISRTSDGYQCTFYYPGGMFTDVEMILDKLGFACTQEDGVFDASITFRAELRYGPQITLGTCTVRWSTHILWGEAPVLYETWGGTHGLDWWLFERGYDPHHPFILSDGSKLVTEDGEQFLCLR